MACQGGAGAVAVATAVEVVGNDAGAAAGVWARVAVVRGNQSRRLSHRRRACQGWIGAGVMVCPGKG
jgi:hypothetical protein